MRSLRASVIRLAHDNPGPLRDALLPILMKQSSQQVDPALVAKYKSHQMTPKELVSFAGMYGIDRRTALRMQRKGHLNDCIFNLLYDGLTVDDKGREYTTTPVY